MKYMHLRYILLILIALAGNKVFSQKPYPPVSITKDDRIYMVPHRGADLIPEAFITSGGSKLNFMSYVLQVRNQDFKCMNLMNWSSEESPVYSTDNHGSRAVVNLIFINIQPVLPKGDLFVKPDFIEDRGFTIKDMMIKLLETGNFFKTNNAPGYSLIAYKLDDNQQIKQWIQGKGVTVHSNILFVVCESPATNLPEKLQSNNREVFNFSVGNQSGTLTLGMPSDLAKISRVKYRLHLKDGTMKESAFTQSKNFLDLDASIHDNISISKPFSYNIFLPGDPDTLSMIKPTMELNPSGQLILNLKPIKYSLIYIDPTRSNKIEIIDKLNELALSGLPYKMYLSVNQKIYTAQNYEQFNTLAAYIHNKVSEYGMVSQDLESIITHTLEQLVTRMDLDVHLFLPDEIYEEASRNFRNRLTNLTSMTQSPAKINYHIYLSEDMKNQVTNEGGEIHFHFLHQ